MIFLIGLVYFVVIAFLYRFYDFSVYGAWNYREIARYYRQ